MKTAINLVTAAEELRRYADAEDLRQFYRGKGIDGLELTLCGEMKIPDIIRPEDVTGIHLHFFPSWIDFWNGDREALLREYGDEETIKTFYGASSREELLTGWRRELDFAHRIHAEYVVFHVSECTLGECLTSRSVCRGR